MSPQIDFDALASKYGGSASTTPSAAPAAPATRFDRFKQWITSKEPDVIRGMGFDPDKIIAAEGRGKAATTRAWPQWEEVGKEAGAGLAKFVGSVAKDPLHLADPIEGMATNIENALHERNPAKLLGAASQVAGAMEAPDLPGGVKSTTGELLGGGQTMDQLRAAKDLNALPFKEKFLIPLRDAVKEDASDTRNAAVHAIDAKFPEGLIDRPSLANRVKAVIGSMVQEPEKLSAPVKELLQSGTKPTGTGDLFSVEQQALEKPWEATDIHKLRTQVGDDAYGFGSRSLSGSQRAANVKVYKVLTSVLDDAAKEAGTTPSWEVGNEKWKAYYRTFEGIHENGEFKESPLSKALSGQVSDEIIEPLTGKNAQLTHDLLQRYKQFAPNAVDVTRSAISRHHMLSTIEDLSKVRKYEALALPLAVVPGGAAFLAKAATMRFLTPPVIRWLVAHGADPEAVRQFAQVKPGIPQGMGGTSAAP